MQSSKHKAQNTAPITDKGMFANFDVQIRSHSEEPNKRDVDILCGEELRFGAEQKGGRRKNVGQASCLSKGAAYTRDVQIAEAFCECSQKDRLEACPTLARALLTPC